MATELFARSATAVTFPEWLDSEHYRFLTGGVTIDSAAIAADANGDKIVASGQRIVRAANGKWIVAPAAALDIAGRQMAILWERVNVRAGDVTTGAIDHGRVILARLPGTVSADQQTALKAVIFR